MTAPDTNPEKQLRRHKPPFIGTIAAVLIAVTAIIIAAALYPEPDAPEGNTSAASTGMEAEGAAATATE